MASKRTRRQKTDAVDLDIEDTIDAQRSELVRLRLEVPKLREEARDMVERSKAMTKRWQTRPALDLLARAAELHSECDQRQSMVREHAFETSATTYLKMHHAILFSAAASGDKKRRKHDCIRAQTQRNEEVNRKRSELLDEYLVDLNQAPAKVAMTTRDVCPRCPEVKLLVQSSTSTLTCPNCGYSLAYLDSTAAAVSFDEVVDYTQYSYKRVNHYCAHLMLVQGKEAHRVEMPILEAVMRDLAVRQRVTEAKDVTTRRVRDALRHNRLRKGYDHVAQITSRISGTRPKRLSREVEEKLRTMFLQMLPAFQRHAPKTRTNFLSYSYVLYRSFQILDLDHMLDGITLLKGRDKLEANDAIFTKMCHDLGWPVFPLPPESDTAR